jgi:hypothetical protein
MAIIRKKKKGLRKTGTVGSPSSKDGSTRRPKFVEKLPPCIDNCPNSNQIREWLMVIAKAEDYGKTLDQAPSGEGWGGLHQPDRAIDR